MATDGLALPLIGTSLVGAGTYQVAKSSVRGIREILPEKDDNIYWVYYSLDNIVCQLGYYAVPEFLDLDILSDISGIKIAHCKAWFSTGSDSYTTFEITANKRNGVIA